MRMLLSVVLCASIALAQEGVKPDRWRNLLIDEATPQEAIEALGQPASRKTDKLRPVYVDDKWVSKRRNEKVFDWLEFKKVEGVDSAALAFLDGKLAVIEMDLKEKVDAAALPNIYGIDFLPKISGFQLAVNPKDYERREGRIYPKTYPSVFYLVSMTEKVFVGAMVGNVGFGAALKGSASVPDAGAIPGKVERVQVISRRLENKDGAELLK